MGTLNSFRENQRKILRNDRLLDETIKRYDLLDYDEKTILNNQIIDSLHLNLKHNKFKVVPLIIFNKITTYMIAQLNLIRGKKIISLMIHVYQLDMSKLISLMTEKAGKKMRLLYLNFQLLLLTRKLLISVKIIIIEILFHIIEIIKKEYLLMISYI